MRRPPRRSPVRSIWPWLAAVGTVAVGLWVVSLPPGWLAAQYARLASKLDDAPRAGDPPSTDAKPPEADRAPTPLVVPRPLRGDPIGQSNPQSQQRPRAEAGDRWQEPGTIYRCKAYGGEMFWSARHCSQHRALIDRIASVPVGLPFNEQVRIAEGQARNVENSIRQEQAAAARDALCSSLAQERAAIWRRSGSGAGYVPLDQLGADQTRWRQIERLLTEHRCVRQ